MMSWQARGQTDRRRERLGSHSPMHRNQSSSPHPSRRNESPSRLAGVSQRSFETTSAVADSSWPSVAMQIPTPSRSLSAAHLLPVPSVPQTPTAVLARQAGQMTFNNNTSNVNHIAPGSTVFNNTNNNNFTQVLSRDTATEDSKTIEKGLGQLHVSRAVHDAQPPTAGCIEGTRVQLLESTQNLLTFCGGAHIVWIAGMAGTGKTSIALTLCRRLVEAPTVLLGGSFFCSRSAGMIDRTDAQRIIPTLATILARRLPAYARALAVELNEDPDLPSKAVTVQVELLLLKPLKSVRARDKQIVFVIDALDECRNHTGLTELINAVADFKTTPLNNPDNRESLFKAIDSLTDLKTMQLDDQARLTVLIDAFINSASRPPDNHDNHARLVAHIDALVDFKTTCLDSRERLGELIDALARYKEMRQINFPSQNMLAELISPLANFKMSQPNYFRHRARLIGLIDAVVEYEATPMNDRDDQERLFQLIDALVESKAAPLDDQASLTRLIGALHYLKTPPPVNSDNRVTLLRLFHSLAKFRATRLDDLARLRNYIDQLAYFKAAPLDNCDNQAALERLISALVDLKKIPLKSSGDQVRLVRLIDRLADLRSTPPIKFLLTSRPEMHIRGTLITDTDLSSIVQLHMVEESLVTSDIRLYIQKTLEESSRSSKWYTDNDIYDLAALSAGLFIFASTVLAYILRRQDAPGRLERLRTVKQQTSASTIATDPLDKMYLLVLMQASDPHAYEPTELDETRRIVAVILSTRTPLTIGALAELLGLSPQHLRGALNELHAVIYVPEQDDNGELRTLHASFGDFIFTRAPEHIRIDRDLGYGELARACLQRMASDDLCFNVSRSRSSYSSNPKAEPGWIARSLIYACLNWAYHIALASEIDEFDVSIFTLKFAFWLEVLSVIGEVHRASEILDTAAKKATSSSFSRFLRDADLFIASSREAIERSAPHIYLSAMTNAPKDSLIYRIFCSNLTGLPRIETFEVDTSLYDGTERVQNARGNSLLDSSMDCHSDVVHAVAISRDSCLVASASADGSVRIWNSQTWQQTCPPLLGHNGLICSVAFSSDGRWIATGSVDTTLRLWNAQTGQSAMPELRGHTYSVSAVAFSPDDCYLASGSFDASIRVWKVVTGQPAEVPQIQCSGLVLCLAYSPSGELIAAGGGHKIVQIFNAVTGQEIGICRPPTIGGPTLTLELQYSITSLAFSPDGAQIVAAMGAAAAVFDVHTGNQVMEFQGYIGTVNAVAYSPDGQFIASGANNGAVRLWSPNTNQCIGPVLHGHMNAVSSVAISSDGRLLVTGGWDKTIRIWDVGKIRPLAAERSHSPLASIALAQYEKGSDDAQLTGWLVSPSGELLLWVPPEHLRYLEVDGHSRVIATRRVVITAEDDVLYQGEQWTRCWRAPVS